MSHPDCIRKLDLTFLCDSCCNDVLCNITCCVCCRPVYLCTVFSRECSTAVTCHSAVSIYNNLSSCQTAVSVWSADHKTACRIDEEFCMFIYHLSRDDLVKYIFLDICVDLFLCHIRIMLCRKYHCIQTFRSSILIILYCYLCLSVRTQVRERSVLAHFCQLKGKFVCHCDRIRHKFCCFVGCISKHHTLISCSDCFQLIL